MQYNEDHPSYPKWLEYMEKNWAARWGELKVVQEKLRSELLTNIPAYGWHREGRLSDAREQAVDIMGVPRSQGCNVAIELERCRTTCSLNVLKVWMHIDERAEDYFLIQVFSPAYRDVMKHWREEAEFVGRKASEDTGGRLVYMPHVVCSWPSEDRMWYQNQVEYIKGMIISE